jgi:rod shape determining protein RodA
MLASVLVLLGLGITVIGTTGGLSKPDVTSQITYALLGLALLASFARFDYRLLKRYTPLLYVAMLVLLILVHVVGTEILGARRWIDLGFFQLQPSEIAKVIFVIIMAKYLSSRSGETLTPREIVTSAIYMVLPLALVITQPDLGTALVFLVIWLALIISARIRPAHLVALIGVIVISIPLVWQLLAPYQQSRLLTFIDPSRDPLGAGYNVTQASIAVGSGGLLGRGLGHGTQSNLNFLPVQHTDFIFAAYTEELGLIGALVLFAIYVLLLFRALRVVRLARDQFGMLLAVGITAIVLFHVLVNVGMNLGIMPVTGIPLPLVSYGGTSIVMTLIGIGILESIVMRHRGLSF